MDRLPQTPDTYDAMFTAGGYAGAYSLPYRHTWYYPLYKGVFAAVNRHRARQLLEVGCGTGGFAHLLFDTSSIAYHGLDFSREAVRQAGARTGRAAAFEVADATRAESYQHAFDTIVCTEVLEQSSLIATPFPYGRAALCVFAACRTSIRQRMCDFSQKKARSWVVTAICSISRR